MIGSSMEQAAALPLAAPALWRRFVGFLGPLVLTNVLQALSGTLNNIYLGRMLGTRAMAAATSFFPLLMFCIAFVIGLGAGASILVGHAAGARDMEKVRRVAGAVLLGGVLLGAIVAVPGVAGIGALLAALGTPADILDAAGAYARVMLLGLPVLVTNLLCAAVLRGLGDTVTPLRMLVVACVVSMTLTPALIVAGFGVPAAAWANVAASLCSVAWLAWYLRRKASPVAWAQLRGQFRLERATLASVVRLGLPTGLFFVTSSITDVTLLSIVYTHGSGATAAWGAVNQVMAYVQFPAMSIAIAASVFTAQAIGASQLHEVDHVTRVGLGLNLALTGGIALLVAIAAPLAAALFLKDAAIVALTASLLRITVWGSILFGMASVFTGVMRAAGTVRVPTLISLGCLVFLLLPIAWALHRALGLRGIWVAYPVTYGCALLLQAGYFFGVWKRTPLRRLA